MTKTLSVILYFFVGLTYSQAMEREYIISNISRLLESYSTVDFRNSTDQEIDPLKYDCAIKVNNFNKQQSISLKALFNKFQQGTISEDRLLRSVLDIRFQNLNYFQRHKGFRFDMKKSPLGKTMHLGPGSSIMCGTLSIEGGFNLIGDDYTKYLTGEENGDVLLRFIPKSEQTIYDMLGTVFKDYEQITDPNVQEVFAPLINDNLYILTQIILGIYSLKPPRYFSDDTYDSIKASRSLWPLLEKVAQGADPFLLDDDVSLFENRDLLKEYELYAVCLLKIASFEKLPLKGLRCIPERDFIQPFGSLKDSGAILGKWLLPELSAGLEILRTVPTTNEKSSTQSPVISKEINNHPSIAASTSANKRKNAGKYKETAKASKKSRNPIKAGPHGDVMIKSSDDSKAPVVENIMPSSALPEAPLRTSAPIVQDKEQNSINIIESDDGEDDTTEAIPDNIMSTSPYQSKILPTQQPTTSPITTEHLFARWNRTLHAQRNTEDIPLRTEHVSPKKVKVIANIFDSETKVTYGEFEKLWKHLNGLNSIKPSHKRSHRRLLNSQGKVVGGTFALHGAKHQYSADNKRELQDALTLIGCGLNYLGSVGIL